MRNMQKWFIMLAVTGLFFLTGCELETSDNGDFDGFWHLERVDTLLSSQRGADYSGARIFWSFQGKLLQLSNLEDNTIIYEFGYANNQLTLERPCMFDRADGDSLVTDVTVLHPYGVSALQETFQVVSLSKESMILQSQVLRLYFRKY